MLQQYNDRYIIDQIINKNFNYHDLDPKLFPRLQHGVGLHCPHHPNSGRGTMQARIYYNEEQDMFYLYCYAEGRVYKPSDFVRLILCNEREKYVSPKAFLLAHMSEEEFISQYNTIKRKKKVLMETQFKKKCEYIDNTYNSSENIVDYIETLYTA